MFKRQRKKKRTIHPTEFKPRDHKSLFICIAIVLVLFELQIFAVASLSSGMHTKVHVRDAKGNLLFEGEGKTLTILEKKYIEKTFAPLDTLQIKLVKKEIAFPFRAWFAAALGVPIGVILLFAFIIKAYEAIFYQSAPPPKKEAPQEAAPLTGVEKILASLSRINIFMIGALIFLGVFLYWALPNMIVESGRFFIQTLIAYKWLFIPTALVALGILIFIIYLKYLLAKKAIESQTEINKYKLQLAYQQKEPTIELPSPNDDTPPQLVEYTPSPRDKENDEANQ